MILDTITSLSESSKPLRLVSLPVPEPTAGEVLIQVSACGVCHTELDEIEGRTPPPHLPVVPGHQVVGRVVKTGADVNSLRIGQRVGVAWIYSACGACIYCCSGRENLCSSFRATGRDVNGGYAGYLVASASFAYPLPDNLADLEAAPLLCAGAIGFRSLRLAQVQPGQVLGLTGFGASGHLVLRMARKMIPAVRVFVFARSPQERAFALELGATWVGDTLDIPPEPLDAVIDTTPVWTPVLSALACLAPGGRLVINAIRKENSDRAALLSMDYPLHLWMEKEIKSVANITRQDVTDFLALAASDDSIRPEVEVYSLEEANRALIDLKNRRIRGAKVLRVE